MQLRADSDLPKRKELLFKIRSVLLTAATLICYFFNQQIIVIMFWLSSIWRLESQNMVSSQQWGGRPCDQLAVQVPPSSSSTPLLSSPLCPDSSQVRADGRVGGRVQTERSSNTDLTSPSDRSSIITLLLETLSSSSWLLAFCPYAWSGSLPRQN